MKCLQVHRRLDVGSIGIKEAGTTTLIASSRFKLGKQNLSAYVLTSIASLG